MGEAGRKFKVQSSRFKVDSKDAGGAGLQPSTLNLEL